MNFKKKLLACLSALLFACAGLFADVKLSEASVAMVDDLMELKLKLKRAATPEEALALLSTWIENNQSEYDGFNEVEQMVVTNMVDSPGTTPYMFTDAKVCHFSIVDPTSYDERLLAYWELYPEKIPDIMVVDCWYGQLQEDPDSWIMRYIENDFGYSRMVDGKYVRFYIK